MELKPLNIFILTLFTCIFYLNLTILSIVSIHEKWRLIFTNPRVCSRFCSRIIIQKNKPSKSIGESLLYTKSVNKKFKKYLISLDL